MDWLKKIYAWCNFQGRADQIHSWDVSPATKEMINQVWVTLPIAIQASVWALVKKIAEYKGDDFAEDILRKVLEALSRVK